LRHDFQAGLSAFEWSASLLEKTPRMDMPGAVSASCRNDIRRTEPPGCAACQTNISVEDNTTAERHFV
jgi:hypothetical protein